MKNNTLITLLIPVHNEEENLEWHHKKIVRTLTDKPFNYSVLYVDDGSTDSSLEIIKSFAKAKNVGYISFSRNFGKEAAVTAGLRKAQGDAVFILDSDGQHPIEMIDDFYNKWLDGYQIITGVRRTNKGEGFIKSAGSKLFYKMLKTLDSSSESTPASTDFRLIDRRVIDEFNSLTERNRITRNLIDWLGFKKSHIPFDALKRHAGKASYSYKKLVKLAIDGAVKHSTRPLKLIGIIGLATALISFLLMIFLVIETFLLGDPANLAVTGTAFLAIFLSLLIGVVLACQGLLGLYLETVYYETQNRPLYVVNEETN